MSAAVVAPFVFFASSASADPTAARHQYERGLAELKAGNLRKARESFEEAYRLSPHYLVLYNLGRASLDLGDLDAAREYFERYLEEGGSRVTPAERARIELLLPAPGPSEATGAGGPSVAPPSAPSGAAAALPAPEPSHAPSSAPAPQPPRANPATGAGPSLEAQLARERQTTVALALGATGLFMGAVGASILVWNQGRFADYERAQRSLGHPPPETVRSQEELDRAITFARATEKNDGLRRSIRDFDVVGWSGAGLGVALLSMGGVLYLTRPNDAAVTVGLGGAKVSVVF